MTAPPTGFGPVPTAGRWPRGIQSLEHRNFRLFWFGQLVSLVGTWMQQVAQGWLVLELTNDPVALGVTAAAQFTPVLAFGLFGGVIADALAKRRTLLFTQAASMVLAAALGLLVVSGRIEVWHVWLLAGLLGVVTAIDMPVRQAFVVEMVGRRDVANAVALNSAVFNGSRIVGPAVAGLLIGIAGIAACFFINAASYLAVIVGLALIRVEELAPTVRARFESSLAGVLGQLAEGLRYVRHTPIVLLAIGLLGVVATAGMNFSVLMPILARDVLGGGAETFGFLMAASGVGSLLSALMIAFGQRPTLRLLLTGAAVFGIGLVGVGLSRSVPLSLALMVVVGWGVIAMAATTNTLIQLTVPDQLRGRVMSVYTTVFAGSTPIGGLFAGTLAAVASAPVAVAVGGLVSVAAAAIAASRVPPGAEVREATRSRRPETG